MTAGGAGEQDRDQIAMLRSLLLKADDERVRARALQKVVQGRVVAATWPNSNEAIRTLTSSDGEQAMPLFTASDMLRAAAKRFGWLADDGSVCSREIGARDALTGALAQGVQFVIIDVGSEHAVEFSREEIANTLSAAPADEAPRVSRSSRSHEGPSVPLSGVVEIDMPFTDRPSREAVHAPEKTSRESGPGAIKEEVVNPRRKGRARPDPRAEADAPAPQHRVESIHAFQDPPAPVAQVAPSPKIEPTRASQDPPDLAAAFPLASEVASKPPSKPPSLEGIDDAFGINAPEPQVRDRPSKTDRKTSAAQAAAKALAGVLATEAKHERITKPTIKLDEVAEAFAEAGAPIPVPAPVAGPPPPKPVLSALMALDSPLDEGLLSTIADVLRKYPEVEWACAVSDCGMLPVIGVRIAATFLTNVEEIRAAILAVGKAQDTEFSVLVLADPQQMRDARSHGDLFFPWRKRPPKR